MFFDLIAWDASAMPFEGPLLRIFSRSCWNINGSFVRHGLGLPLVLNLRQNQYIALNWKPLVSSKRGFGFGRKRPYILAKARRTCWHEDHTDTLSKQFTAAQSPWQCFWQERFFLSLRHIQCRLFLPIAFLHTQKDTNDHNWTSTQASKYWYMAVDILSARWLIPKRTSLTADNATTITQEGRIYHRKRKLPW